jgi:hypothetical protein
MAAETEGEDVNIAKHFPLMLASANMRILSYGADRLLPYRKPWKVDADDPVRPLSV